MLAVCAAIGFNALLARFKRPVLITGAIVAVIFADLTIGYEPPTMPMPITNTEAYQLIAVQEGNFRVLEIPSISTQIAMVDIYTGHDTLSWLRWAYNYYEPIHAPANLYPAYLNHTATAEQAAVYDVRFIILNTNQAYFEDLAQPIEDVASQSLLYTRDQVLSVYDWMSQDSNYELVFAEDEYYIFQNLKYRGFVYSDIAIGSYEFLDPNTLEIVAETDTPTTIYISQSYDKKWTTTVGTLTEHQSIQQLDVPAGSHDIILHYSGYEKSLWWFLAYVPLIAVIIWVLKKKKEVAHGNN
jgi:hypothetical protein